MLDKISLKSQLFRVTECDVQHDGWPCNTCFHSLDIGLDEDRQHEVWLSLLAYRGDYSLQQVGQTQEEVNHNMRMLSNLLVLA